MGTPARSLRRGGSRPETIAKHRHAGAERDHRDTPDRADEVPAAGVRWRRNPALAWLNRVDLYDGRPVSRRGRELPVAAFPQAPNEQPDMLVGRDALARAMRSLLAERGLACVTVPAATPTWQTSILQQPLSVGDTAARAGGASRLLRRSAGQVGMPCVTGSGPTGLVAGAKPLFSLGR